MSEVINRAARNSSYYEARGEFDLFSNEEPSKKELVTTCEIVNDNVTFQLGEDRYTISALKKGFLKIEKEGPDPTLEVPQTPLAPKLTETLEPTTYSIVNTITTDSHLTGRPGSNDIAVKLLQGGRILTTIDPNLWKELERLRAPLKEIVFKIPRGIEIKGKERRHLQKRIEKLLLGEEGIGTPVDSPKKWWQK